MAIFPPQSSELNPFHNQWLACKTSNDTIIGKMITSHMILSVSLYGMGPSINYVTPKGGGGSGQALLLDFSLI